MNKVSLESGGNATSKLGTVGTLADGRKFVHFERHLPYPIETVWAAITDSDRLADWFPGLNLECRLGGSFKIWFNEKCEGPAHVTGTVSRYEPPNVLECGSMRFELETEGDHCKLTFTDILHYEGPRTESEIINSVLGGWHKYLDMLESALKGGKGDPRVEKEFDYSTVQIDGRD